MNLLSLGQTLEELVDQLALEFDRPRHLAILTTNFIALKIVGMSSWPESLEGARLSQR